MKRQLNSLIHSLFFYLRYKPAYKPGGPGDKHIFLDIRRNYFRRYLYTFLKFFHLEGYTIYLPANFRLMHQLKNDHYSSYLLDEKIIHFGRPASGNISIVIKNDQISPDYFSDSLKYRSHADVFHVPMPQHPLMYHAGYWNQPVTSTSSRKKSLFMAGNFGISYDRIKEDQLFQLMSRVAVYDFLQEKQRLYPITGMGELTGFLDGDEDNKIILINRLAFDVPMPLLRKILSRFDFYFALPGVAMPYCHNIVEALSVGVIPFIQHHYAELMKPALTNGINAITFENEQDLIRQMEYIFSLPESEIEILQYNVSCYYNKYFTPSGVVNRIAQHPHCKIYLQASEYSVDMLKKNSGSSVHVLARPLIRKEKIITN